MSTRILAVLLFSTLLLAPELARAQQPPPPQQQQQTKPAQPQNPANPPRAPGQRFTVGLVHLVAAVTDRRNKFVTDLTQNDFEVFEDGREQHITYFNRQAGLPLRIGMLLDTSNSIRERLHFEQDAATDFLYNVIRRGQDQAFLMTFDNEPEVIQDYTGDVSQLSDVIQKQNAGGGTALNDAIYLASERLMDAPTPSGPNGDIRRILVVISDGDDNLSDHALSDAIQMADRSGVSIYAISTNNDWVEVDTGNPQKLQYSEGDNILKELAEETGGRAFFPYRVDDLAQSFLDIGNELRSQYLIGYTPPYKEADGQFHKVELRVDRKGLTVRSRKGYYATAPVTTPAETVAGPAHP
ncbi:MAG: VWA domain-containing protein [Candidatus Acidiferrales bacterium]